MRMMKKVLGTVTVLVLSVLCCTLIKSKIILHFYRCQQIITAIFMY